MKLTLRELFLLDVIAAMGCGWWVRERQLGRELRELDAICWHYVKQHITRVYGK